MFTIVSPFTLKINANNLHDAMKGFTTYYHNLKVNELIIKDYSRHYKANLKYFEDNGRHRVGINFFPYNGMVNQGPLLSGNVLNYTPHSNLIAAPFGGVAVRTPLITHYDFEEKDEKQPVKVNTDNKTSKDPNVERKFYMVSPVASPVLPSVPIAGPLSPFATRLIGTEVKPVPMMTMAPVGVAPMGMVRPTPIMAPMSPMGVGMSGMALSPISPISLFGQRIEF